MVDIAEAWNSDCGVAPTLSAATAWPSRSTRASGMAGAAWTAILGRAGRVAAVMAKIGYPEAGWVDWMKTAAARAKYVVSSAIGWIDSAPSKRADRHCALYQGRCHGDRLMHFG